MYWHQVCLPTMIGLASRAGTPSAKLSVVGNIEFLDLT